MGAVAMRYSRDQGLLDRRGEALIALGGDRAIEAGWYVMRVDGARRGLDCWTPAFGLDGREKVVVRSGHGRSAHDIHTFVPWPLERALEALGCEAYAPQAAVRVREGRGRQARMVWRSTPALPGYLFVRCTPDGALWHALVSLPPVLGVLCAAGSTQPGRLPDGLVDGLRRLDGAPPQERAWRVGERVRIIDGPFRDMIAVLTRVDIARGARMLADIMGSPFTVELPSGALDRA